MKLLPLLLLVALLPSIVYGQEAKGKVLIDAFHNAPNEAFEADVRALTGILKGEGYPYNLNTEPLLYQRLRTFDTLVIITPNRPLSEGEIGEVLRFVQEGGGLLLVGENGNYTAVSSSNVTLPFNPENLNTIGVPVGVRFNRDLLREKVGGEVTREVLINRFENHTIARGISGITVREGCTLALSGKARRIAWGSENAYSESYGFVSYPPVIAASGYGYGHAVALCDTDGFLQPQDRDSRLLVANALAWLTIKDELAEANRSLQNGTRLLSVHLYQDARTFLSNALRIYTEVEAEEGVGETRPLLERAEVGLSAGGLMETSYADYEGKRYRDAIDGFEKAYRIYLELNDTVKAQESLRMAAGANASMTGLFHLGQGQELLHEGRYSDALSAFKAALERFQGTGDGEMVNRTEEMLGKAEMGLEAGALTASAEARIQKREYAKAEGELKRAGETFARLGDANGTATVERLMALNQAYQAAFAKLDEAKGYLEAEDYERAAAAFSEASAAFEALGDGETAGKARAGIEESQGQVKGRRTIFTALGAALLVLLINAGIFLWWRSRQDRRETAEPSGGGATAELERELKRLELRYTQGGLPKKDYFKKRKELEEKLEAAGKGL